ncbi:glycine betaine/proline transport system substrate-binding protein [Pseudomonas sp. NFR09]|uniref:choline ABC transporter substrate-binding protein n=1 Tax=Pseudomonas sp. NFR09 TaxID=1566249 RepID=UPI0008BC059F|nr:choline ABC transporter substrate-binding protein [Pseudomonas sp. NFR09]SET63759.1 glycine betaine/proline transport system substrate-binding protein [Pseudomonas sp. NFR09]
MKNLTKILCIATIFASNVAFSAESTSCKTVKLGAVNWTDVVATTAITQVLLESLGYQVKLTSASQQIVLGSMADKKLDIFMGYWQPTMQAVANPYLERKQLAVLEPPVLPDAQATLAVPDYVYDGGLKSFADIAKFKEKLNNKIYGIEPGAGANRITGAMIKEDMFDLKGFQLVESSEAAMLAAVKRAVSRKEWVVFVGWKPHPMNLQIDGMKYLTGSQDTFGPNDGASTVSAMTAIGYSDQCPNVGKLLHNLKFTSDQVSEVMAPILERTKPDDAATTWLKAHPTVYESWLAGVTTADGKDGLEAVKTKLN